MWRLSRQLVGNLKAGVKLRSPTNVKNYCALEQSKGCMNSHVIVQYRYFSTTRHRSSAKQIIKCKAAVAWGANQPLTIETIEVEPPKSHEVRIKIAAAGLCYTDNYPLSGKDVEGVDNIDQTGEFAGLGLFPLILGHEGAGIVESVGKGVTNVAPGDHVIPSFIPQCYECQYCKNPHSNLCDKLRPYQGRGVMPDGTTRFRLGDKKLYHFMGCSTFSEYTVAADVSVCKINPAARLDRACLIGCGIPTGYGAAVNTLKVKPGSTVAVFGLGGVGLAAVVGAKNSGAKRIIGVDINPNKRNIAKKFGVTDFVNPKDHAKPIQEILIEMTNGGVDQAIECIGCVDVMRASIESCHKGWGTVAILGVAPSVHDVSVNPIYLLTGRTVTGSLFGGYKSRDSVPDLVEQYLKGKIKVDDFVSHEFPLDRINDAFEIMRAGESVRCVIRMG